MNTFANKCVTGNFTILADGGSFLNFNKGSYLGIIIDTTAVRIDKIEDLYILFVEEFDEEFSEKNRILINNFIIFSIFIC